MITINRTYNTYMTRHGFEFKNRDSCVGHNKNVLNIELQLLNCSEPRSKYLA